MIRDRKKEYREYHLKNKEKRNEYSRNFRKENPDYFKNWGIKNKERRSESNKKWYEKNKKKLFKKIKKRRRTDPSFRMLNNLRRRIVLSLKGNSKSANTLKLLGIPNIEFLWSHLEKSFKPGMTRKNHGKWHIDHIIPCASFDLSKPKEQIKCFHYTNLQALWAHENISKGSRVL